MLIPWSFFVATSQAPTVTLTETARPVDKLLQDVAKQVGLPLGTDEEAGQEIVLVSVDHMPFKEFRSKVAEVTDCRWRENGTGFQLRLAPGDPDAELRSPRNARLSDWIQGGQKLLKDAEIRGKLTGKEVASSKLLSLIGAQQMASVPPYGRKVWATSNPTPMQEAIDGDSSQILSNWLSMDRKDFGKADRGGPVPDIAKALVTVEAQSPLFPAITIAAFDASGKLILSVEYPSFPERSKSRASSWICRSSLTAILWLPTIARSLQSSCHAGFRFREPA